MSESPAHSMPASLENLPSSFFKLLPGEELPGVLRCSPRTVTTLQSPLQSQGVDSLEGPKYYNRCLETATRACEDFSTNVKSKDDMMEDFTEALREKIILTKLLLRAQEAYEEREIHLLRYLSQGDIEQLVSEQNPFKDTASVSESAQYFRAVFEHNLSSFSVYNF